MERPRPWGASLMIKAAPAPGKYAFKKSKLFSHYAPSYNVQSVTRKYLRLILIALRACASHKLSTLRLVIDLPLRAALHSADQAFSTGVKITC